jgi:hypothetical protein
MKKFILFLILLLISTSALSNNESLVGEWLIEPIHESKEQFPWWRQIKYPKKLIVATDNGKYSFIFVDQFEFKCEGTPLLANEGKELVFEYCSGLGTKSPRNWGPIHHAKIIDGKLRGVVTNNRYLFTWVGVRQK